MYVRLKDSHIKFPFPINTSLSALGETNARKRKLISVQQDVMLWIVLLLILKFKHDFLICRQSSCYWNVGQTAVKPDYSDMGITRVKRYVRLSVNCIEMTMTVAPHTGSHASMQKSEGPRIIPELHGETRTADLYKRQPEYGLKVMI